VRKSDLRGGGYKKNKRNCKIRPANGTIDNLEAALHLRDGEVDGGKGGVIGSVFIKKLL